MRLVEQIKTTKGVTKYRVTTTNDNNVKRVIELGAPLTEGLDTKYRKEFFERARKIERENGYSYQLGLLRSDSLTELMIMYVAQEEGIEFELIN